MSQKYKVVIIEEDGIEETLNEMAEIGWFPMMPLYSDKYEKEVYVFLLTDKK